MMPRRPTGRRLTRGLWTRQVRVETTVPRDVYDALVKAASGQRASLAVLLRQIIVAHLRPHADNISHDNK